MMPFNLLILKAFHAQKNHIRPLMTAIGLSPGQPKVLSFLAVHQECLQKDLAAACDIEPPTISRMLDNLKKKRLIVRSAPADDRRALTVKLTPAGEDLVYSEILPRYNSVNAISLKGLSEEEQILFRQLLNRMYRNLTGNDVEDAL